MPVTAQVDHDLGRQLHDAPGQHSPLDQRRRVEPCRRNAIDHPPIRSDLCHARHRMPIPDDLLPDSDDVPAGALRYALDHDQARRHLITYCRAGWPTTWDHVSDGRGVHHAVPRFEFALSPVRSIAISTCVPLRCSRSRVHRIGVRHAASHGAARNVAVAGRARSAVLPHAPGDCQRPIVGRRRSGAQECRRSRRRARVIVPVVREHRTAPLTATRMTAARSDVPAMSVRAAGPDRLGPPAIIEPRRR